MEPLSQLVENLPDAVLIKTPTHIVYANRAALTLFGATASADLLGRSPLHLIAPEDHEDVLSHLLPLFHGEGAAVRVEKHMVRLDGGRVDVEIAAAPLLFQGEPSIQVVVRDITERRRASLIQSRLAAIVESSQDAILSVTPDGTIVGWNPGAERLYGYAADEIVGHPLARLFVQGEIEAVHEDLRRILAGQRVGEQEAAHLRKDGTLVDVSVTRSAVLGESGEAVGTAAIVRDITDRRRDERHIAAQLELIHGYTTVLEYQKGALEEANGELERANDRLEKANARLEELATTDGLTGLLNPRVFGERLAEEFRRARRYGGPLSLILLDVDHFKAYNDDFGHPAGSSVLRELGGVLKSHARETDLVARFGGEEFALILPHTHGEEAVVLAERLRAAVQGAGWDSRRVVTASFGVGVLADDVGNPDALIARADAALYRAKEAGRNRVAQD